MRGLFLFLLLIPVSKSYGAACDEIKNQLVVIESQIQSSRLPRCEGEVTKNCCDPKNPELTCSSFLELQNKHNALMGKLVVFEGLISLGKAMEADYQAVQKLDPKKIQIAKDSLNTFLQNYEKAALIDQSLEGEFWFDEEDNAYSGSSVSDFNQFVTSQCQREDESIKKLCARLSKLGDEKPEDYEATLETLHAFGKAQEHIGLQKADKIKEYPNYRKTLEFTVAGKTVPYSEDSEFIHKLKSLKKAIKHPSDSIDNEKAKELASLAKELDGLQVNYGSVVSSNDKFNELFNNEVKNGVASFNQVSRALLDKESSVQNLDKLTQILEKREASSLSSIASIIKEDTECDGSVKKRIDCFEELDQGDDQRAKNKFARIQKQIDSTKDFADIKKITASAKVCISKSVNDSETQDCMEQLTKALDLTTKDKVDDLRAEIYKMESAMENMNGGKKIDELKLSKAMGLKALKNKGCYAQDDYQITNGLEGACEQSQIENFSQEILDLSKSTGEIIDFSENPYLKDFGMSSQIYSAYKNRFLQGCENGEGNVELCRIYKSDEVANGVFNERLKKAKDNYLNYKIRRAPAKADFSQAKKARSAEAFGAGLATSLITRGVPWYMQYEARNSQHQQMMSYHENRLGFLERRNDYWKKNPTIPVYYHPYMNYGYSQYDYNQSGSFGGGNANLLYKDSYDFTQFTFSPTMMDQFGSSNFSGGVSSGVSGGSGAVGGFSF